MFWDKNKNLSVKISTPKNYHLNFKFNIQKLDKLKIANLKGQKKHAISYKLMAWKVLYTS